MLSVWALDKEVNMMKKDDTATIVHEIALATNQPEKLVAHMYAVALTEYRQGARIVDYVSLFAARRVRECLKNQSTAIS
jgi:hypothetical protein